MASRLSFVASVAVALAACAPMPALSPHKALTQYTRTIWTQAEGLPQDTIRATAQTQDGYLWLGTNEGLARFDGYDFVAFTKDGGALPSNTVNVLFAGRSGSLWIGTFGGLTQYRDGKFKTFTPADGLPAGGVSSLVEDHDGVLWMTTRGGLVRFANGKFTMTPKAALGPVEVAQVVYEDKQQQLWVSGVGGVVKRTASGFAPVLTRKELGDDFITVMARTSAGVWLGGNKGLILYQGDGNTQITTGINSQVNGRTSNGIHSAVKWFTTHDGLPANLVRALLEDSGGNLWAGTNGGLCRFENGHFISSPSENKDDASDWVWSLFEDREGDLWVGMNSSLNRFRDDAFLTFGRPEGLPSDQPIAVHQDRNGVVWVGYHDAGLARLPPADARVYTSKEGLPSNEIFAIRDAHNGDLLVATRGGLSRMHDGHFANYIIPDPLGRTVVYDSLDDSQGRLWAATANGVYLFDEKSSEWRVALRGSGGTTGIAVALAEARDGSIWTAMFNSGLWKLTDGKGAPAQPRRFATGAQMNSDQLRSLNVDRLDGTLWIGTFGGGLNSLVNGKLHRYGVREGLLSDNISHVEDDTHGNLWLSTTRGICRVSKQQLRDLTAGKIGILTVENFGIGDGLRSAQVAPGFPTGGGGTRTSDGQLWFPTGRGLVAVDPATAETKAANPKPLVKIVEVMVDGRVVDFGGDEGSGQTAKLKPGTGRVQFRYTGIHLSGPERIRYSSKLEGLDSQWIPSGARRVADYNPLPHGRYRFRVRAELPGGESSENQFAFEVLPYFYQTSAFLWLVAASILGAVYVLYQLRLKQIRGRFALVLEERARLAREIHDTLAQGFVGISSQLDVLAVKLNGDLAVARQHLDLARKMARYSLTEARRSVTDLRTSELEEQGLPAALVAAANKWAAGSQVRVQVDVSGEPQQLSGDMEQNLLRIGQEAVANALKHARATIIRVELEMKARAVCLRVKDDGQGFEPARAFSVMDGHFGILGMRERAERLGGEFDLASGAGAGTQVEVTVPLASKTSKTH